LYHFLLHPAYPINRTPRYYHFLIFVLHTGFKAGIDNITEGLGDRLKPRLLKARVIKEDSILVRAHTFLYPIENKRATTL
jgi:hypothetical protein